MTPIRLLSDSAGLCTVILGSFLAVWGLSPFKVLGNPEIVGVIATPALAIAALCTWYVSMEGRHKNAGWWRNLTLSTPLIGAVFFTVDMLVGSTNGPSTNPVQAGFHAGGPFGIVVTLLVCPITTIVSAGSWVRSSLLERHAAKSGVES